jgi:hypothetical protein
MNANPDHQIPLRILVPIRVNLRSFAVNPSLSALLAANQAGFEFCGLGLRISDLRSSVPSVVKSVPLGFVLLENSCPAA